MALENLSITEVLGELPPEMLSKVGGLITILKAAGILIIIYFAILLLKWILGFRRHRKISKMDKKIDEMDKKLDLLLEKRGHPVRPEHKEKPVAEKKPEKKEKKKKKK